MGDDLLRLGWMIRGVLVEVCVAVVVKRDFFFVGFNG